MEEWRNEDSQLSVMCVMFAQHDLAEDSSKALNVATLLSSGIFSLILDMLGQTEAFFALDFTQIQVFAPIPETDRFNQFGQNKLLRPNAELPKDMELRNCLVLQFWNYYNYNRSFFEPRKI